MLPLQGTRVQSLVRELRSSRWNGAATPPPLKINTRKDMVLIFESPQSDMNKIHMSKKVKESEETCAQRHPPRKVYPASPSPNHTHTGVLLGPQSTKHQETQGEHISSSGGEEKKNLYSSCDFMGYFKLFVFLSHPQGINICRQNLDLGFLPPPPPPTTSLSYLCINMT